MVRIIVTTDAASAPSLPTAYRHAEQIGPAAKRRNEQRARYAVTPELRARLREALAEGGARQAALAATGIPESTLEQIVNGRISTSHHIKRLCEHLGWEVPPVHVPVADRLSDEKRLDRVARSLASIMAATEARARKHAERAEARARRDAERAARAAARADKYAGTPRLVTGAEHVDTQMLAIELTARGHVTDGLIRLPVIEPSGQRPLTRGDCLPGGAHAGQGADVEAEVRPSGVDSCALDVADEGAADNETIGLALGVTGARARQLVEAVVPHVRTLLEAAGVNGPGASAVPRDELWARQ